MELQINDKILYKALFIFAVFDLVTGIISLFVSHLACQLVALSFTLVTLILSIFYAIECKRNALDTTGNVSTVIIGSVDFATSFISVLIVVATTQILMIVASSFTFLKTLKIFVQSEKAKKLFTQTKPYISKVLIKVAPVLCTKVISNINIIKNKINYKEHRETMKEFFKKLLTVVKANLGTIAMVVFESCGAGGAAFALAGHLCTVTNLPAAGANAIGVLFVLALYAGVVVLTVWVGKDSETSAKIRSLLAILTKLVKKLFDGKNDEAAAAIFENAVNEIQIIVDAVQEQVDIKAAEDAKIAEEEAAKLAEEAAVIKAEKEAEKLAKEREKEKALAIKAEEKRQAELVKKAEALLKQREAEQAILAAKAAKEAKAKEAEAQAEQLAREQAEAQKKEQEEIEKLAEIIMKKHAEEAADDAAKASIKKVLK